MVRISDMFHCLFVQATRENSDCNSNYRGASTIRYTYPRVSWRMHVDSGSSQANSYFVCVRTCNVLDVSNVYK